MRGSRGPDAAATGVGPTIASAAGRVGWPVTDRRLRLFWYLLAGSGLVLVICGSFLPWVISGNVRRSSYAVIGVADRLGFGAGGPLGPLIGAWPLFGVVAMTPVLAAALRRWRVAGALSVLVAVGAGAVSFGILWVAVGRVGLTVRLDPIGPAVMAAGSVLLLGGGVGLLAGRRSPDRTQKYSTNR